MAPDTLEALVSSMGTATRGESLLAVGTLAGTDPSGAPLVDWAGNHGPPRLARWIAGAWEGPVASDGRPVHVVLILDAAGGAAPILLGIVREAPDRDAPTNHVELATRAVGARVTLDGTRLELEAREEIVIRCGQGLIRIARDGTVVIRGRRLLSRSSEANVIRGATVKIN